MSKKLKWTPKTQHFTRYYNLGIWFATLDHQENVGREVAGVRWRRGGTQKHDGRWYHDKVRVNTTDVWRRRLAATCLGEARRRSEAQLAPAPVEAARTWLVDAAPSTAEAEVAAVLEGLINRLERSEEQPAAAASTQPPPAAAAAAAQPPPPAAEAAEPAAATAAAACTTVTTEQAAAIASAAAEATSAAAAARNQGAAAQKLETPPVLDEEMVKLLKVPGLKEALEERGKSTEGLKKDLLQRLLEVVQEEAEELEEEEEEGGGEEGPAAPPQVPRRVVGATTQADACGVVLEWYLQECPCCKALLRVRLPHVLTPLGCTECGVHFCAFNAHAAAHPPKPPRRLRRGPRRQSPMQKAMHAFMSQELRRNEGARVSGRAAHFQDSMAAWARHRAAHPEVGQPEAAAGSAQAAAGPRLGATPAQPIVALPVERGRPVSMPLQQHAKVMLLVEQLTPLPLPAFMPLAQRPTSKRSPLPPGAKKLVRQPKPASEASKAPVTGRSRKRAARTGGGAASSPVPKMGVGGGATWGEMLAAEDAEVVAHGPELAAGPAPKHSRPRRAATTHVFLAQPDPQVWLKASAAAARGEPGWGLGRGPAIEVKENLRAARIHDYFSIEYFCCAGRQWLRGILQRVEMPPTWTRFSTCWQLLNETGDTQVEHEELMGGEGGTGTVLDNFTDGDYRVPSEAILPH